MKLVSWNVNGLRACITKGFFDFFNEVSADYFCIQETKMQESQVEFETPNYYRYFASAEKKGYSGTAIFCKEEPISVSFGLGNLEHDNEGRIVNVETNDFYLVNVYTPNSKRALERLDNRMEWEDLFREYLGDLATKKPVIVCGDLNVAHKPIDLKNPKTNTKSAGFTIEERNKFTELLDSGFTDTYRHFYPDQENAYTWWSYMRDARTRDIGWRIDYFLASNSIESKLKSAKIHKEILGSDHCPVELNIDKLVETK